MTAHGAAGRVVTVRAPRFPGIDSVRAIAALSVLAYHLAIHLRLVGEGGLSPYAVQLNIGVAIFFVISGFVLYRPFAAARARGGPLPPTLPYAVRRVLRIVPAYWVALTIVALVLGLSEVFTPRGLVTYYGFLQIYQKETIIGGIGPAWTLCIEVTFYAALPLWARLVRRVGGPFVRSELLLLAALAAASVAWKALVLYVVPADTPGWLPAQVSLPAFADHFAIGMALAVASVAGVQRLGVPSWAPWLLAAAAFALLSGGVPGQGFEAQSLWRHELRGLIGALVLLPAIWGAGAVPALLRHPWLRWLGTISYGVYLWQLPVILELQQRGWMASPGRGALAVAAVALTVAIAAASWYGLERPVLRAGGAWLRRRRPEEVEQPMRAGVA